MAVKSCGAALIIIGDVATLSTISNLLGLTGDRVVEGTRQGSEYRWIFESPLSDADSVNEHVEYFLGHIERHISDFEVISKGCQINIRLTVTIVDTQGGMDFDAQLIKRLTAVPVNLIFSLYSEEA